MTQKQKRFVEEYLIDLNATQAAIRAGYSPSSAADIGSENLRKPDIRSSIDKKMAERSKRTGVNADRVLMELAKIGFVNATNVIDIKNGTLKEGVTLEDTAAIQSVKVKTIPTKNGEGIEREIKLADKIKALELIGKHLGMFIEKMDMNVEVEQSEKLEEIIRQIGGKGLEE